MNKNTHEEGLMKQLIMLFADAAIELIPKEIWSHPVIKAHSRKRSKKPGEMLLDISLHYHAMKKLKDFRKRGRPDIVHFCLLMALGSPLCKAGKLLPIIQTYRNDIISIDPEIRLPRNYNRFVGLIEQLLTVGRVPPVGDKVLMRVIGKDLEIILEKYTPSEIFLLTEDGEQLSPRMLAREIIKYELPMVVIGAYQHGPLSGNIKKLVDKEFSISKYILDAWVVTAEVICAVEDVIDIHEEQT